ncbi:unnamed protein product [Durusdinium trenchii]|uniref:Integrase zinc-binding domain-containing protein n=1 Tax=Durusdinium trenchii TaxID=1381693 RepID=A0ABP0KWC3_9DINO
MADNTTYEDYYQDSWDSWTWDGWHASDVYYDQWVDDHWADSAWSYDAWMREGEEEELWYDAQGTASEWHSPEHYDMAAGDEAEEAPAVEDYQGSAPVEEESATTPSTPPADPAKRSLNFATTLHTSADVFHTVQGHKRRGLLIDPGAAAGLVGSETLRDIIEHCYPNAHREEAITWSDSEATITGISGQPDKALGRVHLQLPLKDLGATYTADADPKQKWRSDEPPKNKDTNSPKQVSFADSELTDSKEDFKRAAKSHALAKKVELNYPEDFHFTAEEAVWIKYLMCEIIKSSLAVFDEAKGEDYIYWLTDPSLLMAVKHCLKKIMHVHGVHVTLHPFVKAFPEPHLSAENAPLRLICRGTYESWQLYALEDLRELSPAQQREAIDEEHWMITFFGNNVPPSTKVPGTPAPGTPAVAAPSTPRPAIADAAQPEEPAAPLAVQPYDEVGTSKAIELRTMKPLYSIKRVLHRLPQEVSKDTVNAKRMLLGLHERLWRANATDLANLLLRAGMPPAVVEMAHEAVANCTICRKHSRLPARPKSKISLAAHFGDEVEMDIFYLWSKPFVLLIDVAARYKIAYETPSRETGEAGRQHTGTGLVERHVALIKLTMQKVKAECDRQGLLVEDSDVAAESSMSHNLCLIYGGYSPCVAVFGVVPRAFYEFETPQMTAITGAADRDATVFETALRLRQIALTAIQQSLAEDRLTRATLHRSHRVDTTELVPGTSTVEIYRDAAWRGPATLLEADQEEGTAIVKHQGKPYLMPLRFVRPSKGVFYNVDSYTGTYGTVFVWQKGTGNFVKMNKTNDLQMKLNKIHESHWDSLCVIYLYHYPNFIEDEAKTTSKMKVEIADEKEIAQFVSEKVMNPPKLFQFLSTGYVEFGNVTKHPTLMRRLPVLHELQEEDLFKDDASLWKEAYEGRPKVSMQKTAMLATLGLAAKPVTRTLLAMTALTSQVHAATSEAPETTWGESWSFPFFIPLTFILLRTLEYLVTCLCRVAMKSMSTPMEAFSYPYFGDREWHCIRCPDEICIADFTAKLETSLSPAGNPRRLETERVYQLANGTGLAWREQLSKQRERSFEPLSSNFSLAIEWMTALKAGMTSDGGMKWNEGESRMKRCSCFTGGALQLSSAQHMTRSATSHVAWMQECDVNLIAMASNLTAMASNLNAMCDYIL